MRVFVRILSCLSIGWLVIVCVYLLLVLPLMFKIVSFVVSLFIIAILAVVLTVCEKKDP